MNRFIYFTLGLFAAAHLSGCCALRGTNQQSPNTLSPAEQRAGWRLLFDGRSLNGWRGYKKPGPPASGWVVENDSLKLVYKSKPGDLITVEKFGDYQLQWEWRISPKGNNGIKYLVSEERSAPGPEYQMIDDATAEQPKHSTASLYDILPPRADKPVREPGQWNASRLVVRGRHVEHWLNGKKVLEYELESPALKAAIAQSKFKNVEGFDRKIQGHILLTDHNDEVWYRNIKIRPLTVKSPLN